MVRALTQRCRKIPLWIFYQPKSVWVSSLSKKCRRTCHICGKTTSKLIAVKVKWSYLVIQRFSAIKTWQSTHHQRRVSPSPTSATTTTRGQPRPWTPTNSGVPGECPKWTGQTTPGNGNSTLRTCSRRTPGCWSAQYPLIPPPARPQRWSTRRTQT